MIFNAFYAGTNPGLDLIRCLGHMPPDLDYQCNMELGVQLTCRSRNEFLIQAVPGRIS